MTRGHKYEVEYGQSEHKFFAHDATIYIDVSKMLQHLWTKVKTHYKNPLFSVVTGNCQFAMSSDLVPSCNEVFKMKHVFIFLRVIYLPLSFKFHNSVTTFKLKIQ